MTSIDDILVGITARKHISFSPLDIEAFSKISLDRAPMHFDNDFAEAAGFRERIVFGLRHFHKY